MGTAGARRPCVTRRAARTGRTPSWSRSGTRRRHPPGWSRSAPSRADPAAAGPARRRRTADPHGQDPEVYVVPRRAEEIAVGATVEEASDRRVTAGAALDLLEAAVAVCPELRELSCTRPRRHRGRRRRTAARQSAATRTTGCSGLPVATATASCWRRSSPRASTRTCGVHRSRRPSTGSPPAGSRRCGHDCVDQRRRADGRRAGDGRRRRVGRRGAPGGARDRGGARRSGRRTRRLDGDPLHEGAEIEVVRATAGG